MITSQTADWRRAGIPIIWVNELNKEEATSYLQQHIKNKLKRTEHRKLITELSKSLQGYPLGLQLAVEMCQRESVVHRNRVEKNLKLVLASLRGNIDDAMMGKSLKHGSYRRSLQMVWETAKLKISNDEFGACALLLLQILAYCNPKVTKVTDLEKVYNHCPLPSKMKRLGNGLLQLALQPLRNLSLVNTFQDSDGNVCVRVHPMIQKFARREDKGQTGLQVINSSGIGHITETGDQQPMVEYLEILRLFRFYFVTLELVLAFAVLELDILINRGGKISSTRAMMEFLW